MNIGGERAWRNANTTLPILDSKVKALNPEMPDYLDRNTYYWSIFADTVQDLIVQNFVLVKTDNGKFRYRIPEHEEFIPPALKAELVMPDKTGKVNWGGRVLVGTTGVTTLASAEFLQEVNGERFICSLEEFTSARSLKRIYDFWHLFLVGNPKHKSFQVRSFNAWAVAAGFDGVAGVESGTLIGAKPPSQIWIEKIKSK